MRHVSPELLDQQIQALRKGMARLVSYSGNALTSGIVSNVLEAIVPTNFNVTWNTDTQRLTITSGTVVVPSGSAVTLPNTLSDLTWPNYEYVFVVAIAGSSASTTTDWFGRTQTSIVQGTSTITLLDEVAYEAADKDNLVLLGVLVKSELESGEYDYEVDTSSLFFSQNRPTFSIADVYHRSLASSYASQFNPHGLQVSDLALNGLTLLHQTCSTGYINPPSEQFGIPGALNKETLSSFLQDPLGKIVAPLCYYLMLPSVPVTTPVVVDSQTGYTIPSTWLPGTPYIQFGESRPNPLTITWYNVSDLEVLPKSFYGDQIDVRAVVTGPVVADGNVITPSASTFDLGAYKGLSLDLSLGMNGSAANIISPPILDSAALATQTSMSIPAITLTSTSQLAFALTSSPNKNWIQPPTGSIAVTSTSFIGTYQLLYTIVNAATSQTLTFVAAPYAYVATLTPSAGSLYRDGNIVPAAYWNIVGNSIYLDNRAWRATSVFTYQSTALESNRFVNEFVATTGTNATPSGIAASASIDLLSNNLNANDSIRVTFESGNQSVKLSAVTNFAVGANTTITATNIASALNTNALFHRRAIASSSGALISITSLILGTAGNAYALEATSGDGTNKFDVSSFSGGGAYQQNANDLVGLAFTLNQPNSDLPTGSLARVYITNEISSATTTYYKLLDIPLTGANSYDVVVTSAVVSSIDQNTIYDTSTKLALTLQISGTDSGGTQVTETIAISDIDCFEPANPKTYRSGLVFSQNVYSKLSSWTVSNSSNIGSTNLVVLASPSGSDPGIVDIAEVSYYGSTTAVVDSRVLAPATINEVAIDQSTALLGGIALRSFV